MSLFSSIRMASNTLRANEIGMQVVGQNIANANTPGYIREEVHLAPAPTQKEGGLLFGMGVTVKAITQKLDKFLEDRLRSSVSDRSNAEAQEETFLQLESLVNELGENDLSTMVNGFFSSISEILNQPESVAARNLSVLQGVRLTDEMRRMTGRASEIRVNLNDRVESMAVRINKLTEYIKKLNIRIAEVEGGNTSASDAVGLRDQRLEALQSLAELIDIRVEEQESGSVNVYTGSYFLVTDGIQREVDVVYDTDRGMSVANIHLKETDSPIESISGELAGLITSRDTILGNFIDQVDDLARTMTFEFNRVYANGQGLNGYTDITSDYAVIDEDAVLNEAGLEFTPVNGSFQIIVRNKNTGLSKTTDILVDLNGLNDDMTLADLSATLDAIDGISSSTTRSGELKISADGADLEFAFAGDTSGLLASLGINTFFRGSSSSDIHVSQSVIDDPAKFAASRNGIGEDTEIAIELADFANKAIEDHNGETLTVIYARMINEMAQSSTMTRGEAEGARVFEETLRGQKLAVSGVSLDEEAVKLMAYQRSFQAAARYISVLDEMFQLLVQI